MNKNKPLPEETDYFYEDVVELNDKTEDKTALQRGYSTEKTLSTISPAILSHYIPGDTPTLYASRRPNSSSFPDDHPLQSNSGGTAFTFFGVPIPPLNFNNIWGQTKGTNKRHKDSRRNSLPKKTSAIEQDGFTSISPSSGSSRPMATTTDYTLFEEETENEDEFDTIPKNKSILHTFAESSGSTRYYFSSTTEPPFYYNKISNSDNNFSKLVNITTRDSLFESATINSIIRSTAKPNIFNNQQQTTSTAIILQNDILVDQSERPSKLSTGNFISYQFIIVCILLIMLLHTNN